MNKVKCFYYSFGPFKDKAFRGKVLDISLALHIFYL